MDTLDGSDTQTLTKCCSSIKNLGVAVLSSNQKSLWVCICKFLSFKCFAFTNDVVRPSLLLYCGVTKEVSEGGRKQRANYAGGKKEATHPSH